MDLRLLFRWQIEFLPRPHRQHLGGSVAIEAGADPEIRKLVTGMTFPGPESRAVTALRERG